MGKEYVCFEQKYFEFGYKVYDTDTSLYQLVVRTLVNKHLPLQKVVYTYTDLCNRPNYDLSDNLILNGNPLRIYRRPGERVKLYADSDGNIISPAIIKSIYDKALPFAPAKPTTYTTTYAKDCAGYRKDPAWSCRSYNRNIVGRYGCKKAHFISEVRKNSGYETDIREHFYKIWFPKTTRNKKLPPQWDVHEKSCRVPYRSWKKSKMKKQYMKRIRSTKAYKENFCKINDFLKFNSYC